MIMIQNIRGYPNIECPKNLSTDGFINDVVNLAEVVSWNSNYENVLGVCASYNCIYEKNGLYDTRMRLYQRDDKQEDVIIVFRPTQQTSEGGNIHVNRQLVPCNFLNNSCGGLVHNRFQQAFNSFIDDYMIEQIKNKTVYIAGHSLGGAFVIFMGIYLENVLQQTPKLMLGLAGPFIGDTVFSNLFQIPLHKKLRDNWFQIESINQYNIGEFDGTVEGYNVDNYPFIYIYNDVICGVKVQKLADSYGMHDLRNYRLFFQGTECS
jgi:hypothetical protein